MEQNLENQYLDYASFKKRNEKLINYLVTKNSKIIARFRYVLMVVDYLFDQVVFEKKTLSLEEEECFEVGYQYIFDRREAVFRKLQQIVELEDKVCNYFLEGQNGLL